MAVFGSGKNAGMRVLLRIWASVLGVLVFAPLAANAASAVRVAAASDLKFALDEVAARFERATASRVQIVYGSSGQFVRQIEQGAPYELFLSADEDLVHRLADRGLTRDRGVLYAVGRIVLFVPTGSPLGAAADLSGVRRALADGSLARFAIANPEHAPYGRAAEQALRHEGLWEVLQGRLVLGENVSQAAQFAASGDASGGIIAYSLALAPPIRARGRFALIDARWHRPLRQRMVLLHNATSTAEQFHAYLQRPAARKILTRYGFALPADP
jgi:molybdate transport system substrate-binding protein